MSSTTTHNEPSLTKTDSTGEFTIVDSTDETKNTHDSIDENNEINVEEVESLSVEEVEPSDDTPSDGVTQDVPSDSGEPQDETNEPPMPSPKECFEKHVGKQLMIKLNKRSNEDIQQLLNVHSPYDMAVEVEKLERVMQPHIQHLQIMKNMARHSEHSKKNRKEFEKTYGDFMQNYKEAEESFVEKKDELNHVVKEYVNGLIDKEQQQKIAEYNATKPLSKGRRRHLWDALRQDDATKLLKTLETRDDVERAAYRCRPNLEHEDSVLMLTVDDSYRVPEGGAVQCLEALLDKHRACFTDDTIRATIKRIHDKQLDEVRKDCLDLLQKSL